MNVVCGDGILQIQAVMQLVWTYPLSPSSRRSANTEIIAYENKDLLKFDSISWIYTVSSSRNSIHPGVETIYT
jgi:hypothetical protein